MTPVGRTAGGVAGPEPESRASLIADVRALVGDFVRHGGRRLAAAVALMLAGGVLEGVGLALLVPIFSLLAPQTGGHWRAMMVEALASVGLVSQLAQLAAVLLVFCLLVGLRAVVLATRDRLVSDLTLGFVDHRRLMLVTDLARARWSALARLRHARIGHILSSEIARLALACSMLLTIMMAAIMLVTQAILMLLLSPVIALLTIGLALLGLALLVPLSRRAATVGTSSARFAFRIAGEAAQFLGGLKIAIAHDMADAFVAQIAQESGHLRAQLDAQRRFQSRVSIASASVASLVGAALIFGAVLMGVPTVTLLAALVVLVRMSGPVRSLQQSTQQLFGVLPAFTALRALKADLGDPVTASRDATMGSVRHGPLRFEQVAFRYPDAAAPVFTGLDFTIGVGEMAGLSGPSGTGKTSVVDLLTGLLEPTAGRIMIGDAVLAPATLAGWRRRLAYVPQDSYLINDSLRRNLTWGSAVRADANLWQALAQAGAADMVAAMPDGLETRVDERGTRLSGGERQRIALARAILRDPDLLILDEATNAIDVATEQAVIANLRRALPRTTILIVAHREETLRACDRVIALEAFRPTEIHATAPD
ncbi:ATP-binding cassette subfamily C protein [Sphingomonas sp. PP-F2F-G114-C0414]|nr:ATP-binding cassette subfamily C protein [Sphingomonas sp. PP-F2F-G114-C0414]